MFTCLHECESLTSICLMSRMNYQLKLCTWRLHHKSTSDIDRLDNRSRSTFVDIITAYLWWSSIFVLIWQKMLSFSSNGWSQSICKTVFTYKQYCWPSLDRSLKSLLIYGLYDDEVSRSSQKGGADLKSKLDHTDFAREAQHALSWPCLV